MGRQIRPTQVVRKAQEELQNATLLGHAATEPPWLRVMTLVPPAETLVRPIKKYGGSRGTRRCKRYQPQKIVFPEDQLRNTFFKEHPWELARPRVILELDGKDHERCDWSTGLRQPGIPLSGECVIQRQLYFMQTGMSKDASYDRARREFYQLRQAEEIEQRVAIEEARYVGGYFGKSRLEVGMQLEDRQFENWKVWAGKATAEAEAKMNSGFESFTQEEEEGGLRSAMDFEPQKEKEGRSPRKPIP